MSEATDRKLRNLFESQHGRAPTAEEFEKFVEEHRETFAGVDAIAVGRMTQEGTPESK